VKMRRIRRKAKSLVTYLYLEMPKKYRTVQWRLFKTECAKIGLHLERLGVRRISDSVQANKVLLQVSPERLSIVR